LSLQFLGRYSTGEFDEGAAEIVTFDAESGRVFVVNASAATVDVLDISNPALPVKVGTIEAADADPTKALGSANSVASKNGVLAVAIESANKTDPGIVALYDTTTLALLGKVDVGSLPDMLTFTPDGSKIIVANEGEPTTDTYEVDPEGSVSIISVATPPTVQNITFTSLNADADALRAQGVRIFGPNATVAQDLEPEYVAVSADGKKAWVTLQENNALAIINVETATLESIVPLGFKNHALLGNEFDASDRDDAINIRNWPVFGMYQPDAIASYQVAGKTFLVTANEGDARDYPDYAGATGGFVEVLRVGNAAYTLDPTRFPDAATLKLPASLGRLNVTTKLGNTDADAELEAIYTFGARSFSIWDEAGKLVYDSGNELELRTAKRFPATFNAGHDNNTFDNRSDDKGPEPEAVTLATIDGATFAFVGMERIGGVMVYDISLPETPRFVSYVNTRDFTKDPEDDLATVGDLGPEASVFISAEESPTGKPLLVLGNEISGTTAIFEVTPLYGATP
jgi:DNA-binding beta-propeller fold protein YncE